MRVELADLQKELLKLNKYLIAKLSEQRSLVEDAAATQRTYSIAKAKEILKQKSEGIAVTAAKDIAYGVEHVADLRYERDVARGVSDACREAIRSLRGSMSGIQSLVSVEKAKMNLL